MSSDKDESMVSNEFYLYRNKLEVALYLVWFFDCNQFNSLFMFRNWWFVYILNLMKVRNTINFYKLQNVLKMELIIFETVGLSPPSSILINIIIKIASKLISIR